MLLNTVLETREAVNVTLQMPLLLVCTNVKVEKRSVRTKKA